MNTKSDLGNRTLKLSKDVIDFCKTIPENTITRPIISQVVRSGTSIGANYQEASEASSNKDFINKIYIAQKEVKETIYWFNLLAHTAPRFYKHCLQINNELQQLNLIFSKIIKNVKLKELQK